MMVEKLVRIALAGSMAVAFNSAMAQTVVPHEVLSNGGLLHSLVAAPVAGEPYTATQTTHTRHTLADGTTVSHSGHHTVARDAEGRVRVERRIANGRNGQPDLVLVFVTDPVAHTLTTWVTGGPDPQAGSPSGAQAGSRIASVIKLPAQQRPPEKRAGDVTMQPTAADTTRPPLVITTEDLGADMLDGQSVAVSKTTTIIPAGHSGNDAPITKTREVWTSAELKLVLKEQWEDPQTGEKTVELEQLSRTEPDPSLFRAPAGYQVKSALETLKEAEEKLAQTPQN